MCEQLHAIARLGSGFVTAKEEVLADRERSGIDLSRETVGEAIRVHANTAEINAETGFEEGTHPGWKAIAAATCESMHAVTEVGGRRLVGLFGPGRYGYVSQLSARPRSVERGATGGDFGAVHLHDLAGRRVGLPFVRIVCVTDFQFGP
nr:hypothetical protein [Enhygromyxa salina]